MTSGADRPDLMSGAERLRAMHTGPRPLVLPNVWDAASARAFAQAGFPALATSSSAMAHTLGYRDGHTPANEMFAAVARIARAVSLPVTADIENGYGLGPAELVGRLAEAGVVGCNLEDSDPVARTLTDPERQADFIAAVRAESGPALVINARVDVFVRPATRAGAGAAAARDGQAGPAVIDAAVIDAAVVHDAIARARRYLAVGADCTYPIIAPASALAELVSRIGGPVNAMYIPGGPGPSELASFGVARITFGGGLHSRVSEAVHSLAVSLASEWLPPGS